MIRSLTTTPEKGGKAESGEVAASFVFGRLIFPEPCSYQRYLKKSIMSDMVR